MSKIKKMYLFFKYLICDFSVPIHGKIKDAKLRVERDEKWNIELSKMHLVNGFVVRDE